MKGDNDTHKLDLTHHHDTISSLPSTCLSLSHPSRCPQQHNLILNSESVPKHLRQEILSLLSQWNGLQMAIKNSWGGSDSHHKYDQLVVDILSVFSRSKGPLCPDDVENLLHESLLLSFNTEIEDGSIEEVAEQLTVMYEDYLQGSHR